MQTEIKPISIILKEELFKRKSRNPSYSLRAFAKDLGLSSSFISKVLNGQKNISDATLLKLTQRLKLDDHNLDQLTFHLNEKNKNLDFIELDIDIFQAICDWEHFALLEAVTLNSLEPTVKNLAQLFKISEERTQTVLDRLVRLEFIKKDSNGHFKTLNKNFTNANLKVPTSAHTEHERQLIKKSLVALDEVPHKHRSQSSITMAIPAHRMQEAREKIKEFQRDMMKLLQRKGKRDSVYHLSVSFFPLTKIEDKN